MSSPSPPIAAAAAEAARDIFQLSRHRLSVDNVVAAVASVSCGAISLFVGTTRQDRSDGGKVIGLEYEAYESMVRSELAELCQRLRARWPDLVHICVHHRLGWVAVGEASVVAAVSSPHRRQGQQALANLLDGLKANVPVWKKEVYEDRGSSWKENAECAWASCHGSHTASTPMDQ
ncbi:molybdopterin synthase catalytic subunit [Syngnathus acus]|uniref:molybdopterin synthase catalytic subunit n=1 Tax=Syngnathus acus TaxID=161584 RepID=UPI001886130E|nr:molybdopterin synthase catalytic subunit [Syngnathus acus]